VAIYRKVAVRMWGDEKVMALSRPPPCGQVLWFHLLAGEQTDIIPGLCRIGESAFAEQLGWPLEGFRKAFQEVFAQGMAKADWKARVVWVPKAIEHNAPASPNVVRSWADAWDRIPECSLKVEAWQTLKAFLEGMAKGFQEAFAQACPKPSLNQEQDQEQDQEETLAADDATRPPPPEPVLEALALPEALPSMREVSPFVAWLQATYPDVKDPWTSETAWKAAYPGIDLLAEGLKASAWEVSSPTRKKTAHGKFLNGWFSRAQQDASRNGAPVAAQPKQLRKLTAEGLR
jgi:hypothetical protein